MTTEKMDDSLPWGEEALDRDAQRQQKRDAILRIAAREFCAKGYHRTSLNDIAERLNVTKPSLYYYVKNKDDILFQCHREALEQLREPLETARRGDRSGRERLRGFMAAYADLVSGDFGRCLILCTDQVLQPDLRDELWSVRRDLNATVCRMIEDGIADGSIAPCDPTYTAFALFGAFNWISHWYTPERSVEPARIAELFCDLFERGLSPR